MNDSNSADGPPQGLVECGDCHGQPGTATVRTVGVYRDGTVAVTWHRPDCTDLARTRALLRDSARRAGDRDA
jgi:hypothetical protein